MACALAFAALPGCRAERGRPTAASQPSPQRIITFAPSSTEIIAALGVADRLVGVGTFCTYPPQVAKLPKVGGLVDPDLEGLLRLKPDLVVVRGEMKEVEQLCESNHIRLFRDPIEKLDDLYRAIGDFGVLLHRREAAEKLVGDIHMRLDRIAASIVGRPRPRVFITVSRRDPDALAGLLTANGRTFIGEMVALAGGDNVFANLAIDYPEVSPEAILAARPEVIIEAMPEMKSSPALETRIREVWRRLGPIPAVENNRIYVVTDDNILIPSPRVVDAVAALARLLHPEAAID
ncbi:MAG TPA: helical backbone metal receptor [Phycisphaerae bacterium]|nr:helical backbone metal receptor [Phycisphaerae bacterium]